MPSNDSAATFSNCLLQRPVITTVAGNYNNYQVLDNRELAIPSLILAKYSTS
jgi:hypothetical protein